MTKSSNSKKDNINPTISKKLGVADYVFNYKNVDFNNARIEYVFGKSKCVIFVDGIKKEETYSPTIDFSISANDKNKKTYSFDFMINMDIDMLNKMPNKPFNINEYIVQGELFFHNPYIDKVEFMDFSLEEDIYQYSPSFFVQKIEDNKFTFKISYQCLFIWFNIDFSKNQ